MNDFTKDELQEIVDIVNDINNGSQRHGLELYFELRNKVQSMIDNYCDHAWENVCCQCAMSNVYCYKCEKSMDEI